MESSQIFIRKVSKSNIYTISMRYIFSIFAKNVSKFIKEKYLHKMACVFDKYSTSMTKRRQIINNPNLENTHYWIYITPSMQEGEVYTFTWLYILHVLYVLYVFVHTLKELLSQSSLSTLYTVSLLPKRLLHILV